MHQYLNKGILQLLLHESVTLQLQCESVNPNLLIESVNPNLLKYGTWVIFVAYIHRPHWDDEDYVDNYE